MVERKYLVDGKEVTVNIYVIQTNPPQLVFEIYADPETVKKYVDESGIAFAVNIDDVFDALRESLSPSKIVRD
jgi:hypothetical protein